MTKLFKCFLSAILIACMLIIGVTTMPTISYAEEIAQVPQIESQNKTLIDDSKVELTANSASPTCDIYTTTNVNDDNQYYQNTPPQGGVNIITGEAYNAAVVYHWQAGEGATGLSLSTTGVAYYDMDATTYDDMAFPISTNTNSCKADFVYGRSKIGTYYSSSIMIGYERYYKQLGTYSMEYDYNCKYLCVGKFDRAHSNEEKIPTEFDQTGYIWNHTSNWSHHIKGTIAYGGEISDIQVIIPILGYQTVEVTLGGVTFYLRTGPNKCSIKAGSSVPVNDLQFAFGIGA